jgi:hypothetical protein
MPSVRDELLWTVSYALWQPQRHIPRGKQPNGWPPSIEHFRAVADAIVAHLELCGYEMTHKAPRAAPTTHGRR